MNENCEPSEAVVICTRNRPDELRQTLTSVARHPPSGDAMLIVVDASDADIQAENRRTVNSVETILSVHWPYTETPSSARQRNTALDRLPPSVEVVHFIDDDVTVHEDYFDTLSDVLPGHPKVGGVGGRIHQPKALPTQPTWLRRLFLLSSVQSGAVLPSGCAESAQIVNPSADAIPSSPIRTEWLSSCSSTYRRDLLREYRFTTSIDGYALLEDLELSYRIGQDTSLLVVPEATLTHRVSTRNRLDLSEYIYKVILHRYWFVTTTLTPSGGTLPFWWALLGEILACAIHPQGGTKLRGLVHAVRSLLTRDHSLFAP
jgi:GT2 family glycosyltransferase